MKRFLKWFAITFAVIFLLGALCLGYAYFVEPRRLVVNEVEVRLPRWSSKLNDFKIAAVSDIHGGSSYVTPERLRDLTERINAQNPDIIVLLGDFVSQVKGKHSDLKLPIETIAESLSGLRAKYGVFAVIGNHDWWYDESRCRAVLEKAGIRVLENEVFSFPVNNQTVTIVGIEDYWKRRQVPADEIMKKIPPGAQNLIAITHNPDSFDKMPAAIPLLIAGHTHGGQVRIPFYGAPLAVSNRKFYRRHYVENDRHAVTTSGFGTSGPPLRFGVPPEIMLVTLNSGQ